MSNAFNYQLETLLIKNSPTLIRGGNVKNVTTKKTIPTQFALKKYKFVHFNSQERISWIIIDVDHTRYAKNMNELEFYIKVYLKIAEPTFITKTDKGFQIGYLLRYPILKEQTQAMYKLRFIKAALSRLFDADPNGTNRNLGIWRNPLKHIHKFVDKDYTLDEIMNSEHKELYDRSSNENVYKQLISTTSNKEFQKSLTLETANNIKIHLLSLLKAHKAKADIQILHNGWRKATIFQAAMLYAKHRSNLSKLRSYVLQLNKYCVEPLKLNELEDILKSVTKYKQQNSIFVTNPLEKQQGKMNLNENLPLHVKQKKGAKYTNNFRIEKAKLGIELAVKALYKRNEQITNSKIAREANITRQTVAKYSDVVERVTLCIDKQKLRDFFLKLKFNSCVNNGIICFITFEQNRFVKIFPFVQSSKIKHIILPIKQEFG
jgi:hypothetical protein